MAQGPPYYFKPYKWYPNYWPNEDWEVVDLSRLPGPPPDTIIPWWKAPKDQWPWPAPWEPKVFGAFPASKVTMPENLVGIPPFGYVKVNTPSRRPQPHSMSSIKIHMKPWMIPTQHWRLRTKVTPSGPEFYWIGDDIDSELYAKRNMHPIWIYENALNVKAYPLGKSWLQYVKRITADDKRNFVSNDMREVKTQIDEERQKQWSEKLPPKPQPRDLFS